MIADNEVFSGICKGKTQRKLEVISLGFNELTMIAEDTFGDLPVRRKEEGGTDESYP